MLAFVLPTRDRPQHLARTLDGLAALPASLANRGAEVVIVDNAPLTPLTSAHAPARLANNLPVTIIRSPENLGAAARNIAAAATAPSSRWLIMLDDDSHPTDARFIDALADADPSTLAIAAEISLPSGQREAGGLPEVFVGCGVAIRRDAFLAQGGYDPTFGYYAEEYDLAAKLLLAGGRVVLDRRFRVLHEKTTTGRDMNRILARLVRNNGWVIDRYAPEHERQWQLDHMIERYARIAEKESASTGFAAGLGELRCSLPDRPRRRMPAALWDRFTGQHAARLALAAEHARIPLGRCAIVARGKNDWAIERALTQLAAADDSVTITTDPANADTLIVGTLSPGPMLDAADSLRRDRPSTRVVLPMDIQAARPAPQAPAVLTH